jgi:hypothetical protein
MPKKTASKAKPAEFVADDEDADADVDPKIVSKAAKSSSKVATDADADADVDADEAGGCLNPCHHAHHVICWRLTQKTMVNTCRHDI